MKQTTAAIRLDPEGPGFLTAAWEIWRGLAIRPDLDEDWASSPHSPLTSD